MRESVISTLTKLFETEVLEGEGRKKRGRGREYSKVKSQTDHPILGT